MSTGACQVSIVIKTLNEERNIARAIESSLAALREVGGEVVVADSASTDRTVEIASTYPVTVVQLSNPAERCCGIGPELGYQHASGRYIYILDGDMQFRPGFLAAAVQHLEQHPGAGGVAGLVVENNLESLEFKARVERGAAHMKAGEVDRLDMGGLYRREAIEQVGYFSDRNLHSYEELDLAVRLRAAGWTLHRIETPAVDHFGHDVPAHQLLLKRWKSRYINGVGEVITASAGTRHRGLLLQSLREARLYSLFGFWMLAGPLAALAAFAALGPGTALACLLAWLLLPWGAFVLKKGSLAAGSYALASLALHVGGLLRGLLSPRRPPTAAIAARVLKPSSPPIAAPRRATEA